MVVEKEGADQYIKRESDPTTGGTVEKVDTAERAKKASEDPEGWREQK